MRRLGVVNQVKGKKLAYRIAKADVISGLKPKVNREPLGPYKKRMSSKTETSEAILGPDPRGQST